MAVKKVALVTGGGSGMGEPAEVAAALAFFVSEDVGYITAQMLGINGGTAV